MKKIFLRRILPLALCLLMVLPMFAFNTLAANNPSLNGAPGDKSIVGTERANWAPNGQGYHSSVWNNDRHSKYLNNGTYNHSYQWWEPTAPERPNGAGVDPTKQYFGFSFDDGYYLLDEIVIYAESFEKGWNNIKYTVEALILGEWVVVGVGYQDDGVVAPEVSDGSVVKLTIPLVHPNAAEGEDVNTNNIRVWTNEYGYYAKRPAGDCNVAECNALGYHVVEKCSKAPSTHDWWYTPKVQEVELMGYTGYKPEFEVPMNAYLVTNAALSGMLGADSSVDMYYPGLAGDDDISSYWKAGTRGANNVWAEFDQAYTIDNVGINVGGMVSGDANITLTYNIYILVDGTVENGSWKKVVSDATAVTQSEAAEYIIHDLDAPTLAKGMKVEITGAASPNDTRAARPVVAELWAEISDGDKCIFLADYITAPKKASTSTGNLACYGKAYASSNFSYAGISKVNSIIDGNTGYADGAWIAENYLMNTYVGVTLREAHDVTKVVLYFNDVLGGTNGEHVFKFEVQAKVNGNFIKVGEGTTYDANKKTYISSIELKEAVNTDDVRIVFKSDAQTFPYLKEFEIFEGDFVYSSYIGYVVDSSRTQGGPSATKEFGEKTVAQRGKYFNKLSPIEYFNIALEHDVEIDWLG